MERVDDLDDWIEPREIPKIEVKNIVFLRSRYFKWCVDDINFDWLESAAALYKPTERLRERERNREIILDFIEAFPEDPSGIYDISKLPHPKNIILENLHKEYQGNSNERTKKNLLFCAWEVLPRYQPGVGKKDMPSIMTLFNPILEKCKNGELNPFEFAKKICETDDKRFKEYEKIIIKEEKFNYDLLVGPGEYNKTKKPTNYFKKMLEDYWETGVVWDPFTSERWSIKFDDISKFGRIKQFNDLDQLFKYGGGTSKLAGFRKVNLITFG